MKSYHLGSEKILAIFDTGWDVNDLVSLVLNDHISGPFSVRVSAFLDFEPGTCK